MTTNYVDSPAFNGDDQDLTLVVIRAVSVYANKPPSELPPFNDVVDADALNSLLQSDATEEVTFSYAGFRIRLSYGEGTEIEVTEERA